MPSIHAHKPVNDSSHSLDGEQHAASQAAAHSVHTVPAALPRWDRKYRCSGRSLLDEIAEDRQQAKGATAAQHVAATAVDIAGHKQKGGVRQRVSQVLSWQISHIVCYLLVPALHNSARSFIMCAILLWQKHACWLATTQHTTCTL